MTQLYDNRRLPHASFCNPFTSLSPPPHRVLQWTTFIERTFCTENEPDRYVSTENEPDRYVSTENEPDGYVSTENEPDRYVSTENEPDGYVSTENEPDGYVREGRNHSMYC